MKARMRRNVGFSLARISPHRRERGSGEGRARVLREVKQWAVKSNLVKEAGEDTGWVKQGDCRSPASERCWASERT